MFVSSIEGFQELTMDFSMTIYFRQWWRDSRLAYGDMYHRDSVTIGGDILKQIWLPDTHFEYEKKPKDRTRDHVFLLKLWRDGTIMWSRSDSITTTCAMDLRSYPMDTQRCNFSIESFGYPINDVVYKWRLGRSDEDIKVKQDLALTKFTLWKIQTFTKISHYVTGSFSGIVAEFTMTRRALYYVIQIFLPCAMIVFLSWISFWIDSHSTPARIALGITTVLSMTTLLFGVQSSLPKVPYVKSLDVYMFVSFTLVFASLIEYACVHYNITKKDRAVFQVAQQQKQTHMEKATGNKETVRLLRRMKGQSMNFKMAAFGRLGPTSKSSTEAAAWSAVNLVPSALDGKSVPSDENLVPRVNLVDRYSRVLFPSFFLVFNIIYWPIYML
ncbi:glycine receptor subunit alpha-2 isoform X2 [Nematostella vectensis]|nr:glycine receptor subunit alpha-2 isoform X2 [Nematostella vectensis]XP_032235841.1 glycine receptor subunit alpha-2 isoform X2 [Nematostella vectensis]